MGLGIKERLETSPLNATSCTAEEIMDFARKIRTIRERKKLIGEELGKMLGVGKSTIANWEAGKSESRSPGVLRKIDELWQDIMDPCRAKQREAGRRELAKGLFSAAYSLIGYLAEVYPEYVQRERDAEKRELVIRILEF